MCAQQNPPIEQRPGTVTVELAAIRDEAGAVHSVPRPGRHADVVRKMARAGADTPIKGTYGFVLSDGSFADRRAAKDAAVQAGQVRAGMGKFPELYSEDLWL